MKITSTRRLFLAGTGAVGGAAALAACGGQQTQEEQASEAAEESGSGELEDLPSTGFERMEYDQVPEGGQVLLSVSQLPNNWNSNQTDGNLYDLTKIRGPLGAGAAIMISETGEKTFNPDYIVSAELTSEDPQTVAFSYNPDAVWEDGSPIVVDDLIAQWNANKGEDEAYELVSTTGWELIESIEQTDDEYTGEIVFSSPFIDWITVVHPDVPASISESAEEWNEGYVSTPTPSYGPFKVDSIDDSAGIVTLVHNENWWGRAPKLEKIIFQVVDQTTAPQSFANGEIDVYEIANGDELTQAKTRSDAGIQKTNGLTWTHVTLNVQGADGKLDDVKVREAIARGIDRNAIGQAVVGPLESPVVLVNNFVYMPGQAGYEDSFGGLEFDPEAAGALLDEAGWMLEGDVRMKDGEELAISVIVPADTKSNEDRARQIQTNLSAIGVNIEMETVPSDAYFDDYVIPKNFDMVTFSWVGTAYPESSAANLVYPVESGQNFTNYADDQVGEIDDQMLSAFEDSERQALANEMSTVIANSFVVIPFYATPEVWGVKTGIVNYGPAQFETYDWTAVGVSS